MCAQSMIMCCAVEGQHGCESQRITVAVQVCVSSRSISVDATFCIATFSIFKFEAVDGSMVRGFEGLRDKAEGGGNQQIQIGLLVSPMSSCSTLHARLLSTRESLSDLRGQVIEVSQETCTHHLGIWCIPTHLPVDIYSGNLPAQNAVPML